jgi:4-hydroxy-3-polyprenylbenzoate decarboxylase
MVQLAEMGAVLVPPMPAFYHRPVTVDDIVNQTVGRILDLLGLDPADELFARWKGGPTDPSDPGPSDPGA